MKLDEINNYPTLFATDVKPPVKRPSARTIAKKRIRRKSDKTDQYDPDNPHNKKKSRFIDWLSAEIWTKKGQNEQPENSKPDLGPKFRWDSY